VDVERIALHAEQCSGCGTELADLTAMRDSMRDSMTPREPVTPRRLPPPRVLR
jgi:hypothetical protein